MNVRKFLLSQLSVLYCYVEDIITRSDLIRLKDKTESKNQTFIQKINT